MADVFATVEDLESRWRGLSEQERKRAAVLLEDATDLIKSSAPRWQHATAGTLKRIACAVVKRALQAEQGAADGLPEPRGLLASEMHTTGPFTDQYAYSNPEGDLFLRAAELKQLGGRRSAAFEVDLLAPVVAP